MPALALEITMLPGARELLAAHARELPQRDDLCGAFCGALALRAAGIESDGGQPLDQDAVARAAGSVVGAHPEPEQLPYEERGRRDYRIAPPLIEDGSRSGTTAGGLVAAIERLGGGRLAAIPLSGPWSVFRLAGLFDLAASLARPSALLANLATRQLWGTRVSRAQLLDYLIDGRGDGSPPEWDVGHFACIVARVHGPGGDLYAIADTYPSLGEQGVHLQPRERLAQALERPEMAPGGVIAVADVQDAPALRAGADALGLHEEAWDNGSLTAEMLA